MPNNDTATNVDSTVTASQMFTYAQHYIYHTSAPPGRRLCRAPPSTQIQTPRRPFSSYPRGAVVNPAH